MNSDGDENIDEIKMEQVKILISTRTYLETATQQQTRKK
jgi:hypothetical protein